MIISARKVKFLLIAIVQAFFLSSLWAAGVSIIPEKPIKTVNKLASGKSVLLGNNLPEESFAGFWAYKLKEPKFIWLNTNLLREMGLDVSTDDSLLKVQEELLDRLGHSTKFETDPEDLFTFQKKRFYADRYQGGTGLNSGSARAGITGHLMVKGLGLTPLKGGVNAIMIVPKDAPAENPLNAHTGKEYLHEAIKEAVWSEVLNQELPYGAVPVVGIIDRGTTTEMVDDRNGGYKEIAVRDVLVVRVNPLRLGNFKTPPFTGRNSYAQGLYDLLPEAFPVDHSSIKGKTAFVRSQKSHLGFREFSKRFAHQQAAIYARSLYHGAPSSSNIATNGAMLDFGTSLAQPGFSRVSFLDHVSEFGDLNSFREVIVNFVQDFNIMLMDNYPRNFMPSMWSKEKEWDYFRRQYYHFLKVELLQLTGVPPHLIEKKPNAAESRNLYKTLKDLIAQSTKDRFRIESELRDKQEFDGKFHYISDHDELIGQYDIHKILSLVAGEPLDEATLDSLLINEINDNSLRKQFIAHYIEFIEAMHIEAESDGVTKAAFLNFISIEGKRRNRKYDQLYMANMYKANETLNSGYISEQNEEVVSSSINKRINDSRRTFRDLESPYQTVVWRSSNPSTRNQRTKVFDAQANEFRIVTEDLSGTQGRCRSLLLRRSSIYR